MFRKTVSEKVIGLKHEKKKKTKNKKPVGIVYKLKCNHFFSVLQLRNLLPIFL